MAEPGGATRFLWQFVDGEPILNRRRSLAEVPAETPEARAMSKALKQRGFKFCGPTICYAFMQAVGMVDDHVVDCFRHGVGATAARPAETVERTVSVAGDYLGMALRIDALDQENLAYFRHCAAHDFHLQRCDACGLLRYPPTTGCPWCGRPEATWTAVAGRGAVFTYAEVHHAIQPAFKDHLPYLVLIVELDTQKGVPTEHDGLRIAGNLATSAGDLAPPELVASVGIGTRVRMVFKDVARRSRRAALDH